MMKKKTAVTTAGIIIGIILMFTFMRFFTVPSGVPNTNLNMGIVIVSVFAVVFGPLAGLLIGFIGHTLADMTLGWGIWWTWIAAESVYGFIIGLLWKLFEIEEGRFGVKEALIFNGVQYVSNSLVWVLIAPTLDIIIYQEPSNKVYVQGLVATGLNSAVVLIFGTALIFGYYRIRTAFLNKRRK